MTGYVRVDTSNNIADGNVISAADLDNEFDGIQAAFNASTGHNHDGTTGEGAPISVLGPTQDVVVGASTVTPKTTNTVDIGSSSLKFKDLYLAGNASIGGTLAVTGATTLSSALTYGGVTLSNAVTGTGNMVLSASPTLTGTLSGANASLSGTLAVTGVATLTAQPILSSLTASSAVFTDGSKGLVSNAITGTGNVVMSASPTLTGTITAAALTTSSTVTLNGGTANGVAYLNGSKVLTTGSALAFDGTNLGIGTSSPAAKLDVTANAVILGYFRGSGGSSNDKRLTFTTGGDRVILDTSDNSTGAATALAFATGGTERMRLLSTGNLGIGNTSPDSRLRVLGATSGTGPASLRIGFNSTSVNYFDADTQYFRKGDGTSTVTIDSFGNVGIGTSSPGARLHLLQAGGARARFGDSQNTVAIGSIEEASDSAIGFFTQTSTERMRISSAGNVGIGTSSPQQKLQVSGGRIRMSSDNVNGGDIAVDSTGLAFSTLSTTQPIIFLRNNYATESMRIDSSGNVGIGTSSPQQKLDVNGRIRLTPNTADLNYSADIFASYDSAHPFQINVKNNGTSYEMFGVYANGGGGNERAVFPTGNVGIGTSSPAVKLDVVGAGVFKLDGSGSTTPLILRNNNTASTQLVKLGFDSSGTIKASINAAVYGNDYMTFNVGSDTERMRLDSSGNLGVGTTSPTARIHSNGTIQSVTGSTGIQIYGDGGTGYVNSIGAYPLVFQVNSTERARIDSSGNLGLGVTPSAWSGQKAIQFAVGSGFVSSSDSAFRFYAGTNAYYNGTNWIYKASTQASLYEQGDSAHKWYNAPSGTAGNAISFTQAMTLDASGRLGVGETSPAYRVSVRGTPGSTGHTECLIQVGTDADVYSAQAQIRLAGKYGDAGYAYIAGLRPSGGTATDNALVFGTVATERARIDSSGNLLVGTTSTYGGPGRINVGFNQSTNFGLTFRNTSATATGVFISFENSAGGGNGSISQTNSTTVAYNTSSDRRLKKDIVPAPQAGADIDAIQVVSHGWVSNDDSVKYGVIAQDLKAVAPQAVSAGDDGQEIERTWGVDYSKLVPMLIKEVQALRARVAALESI